MVTPKAVQLPYFLAEFYFVCRKKAGGAKTMKIFSIHGGFYGASSLLTSCQFIFAAGDFVKDAHRRGLSFCGDSGS